MYLWCRLVAQATTTLNILRKSNINPRLSAKAQLNGAFDYNVTPLATPGCRVGIYENSENGKYGRRIESMDGTSVVHTTDAIQYMPRKQDQNALHAPLVFFHDTNMPTTSSTDNAAKAARMLVDTLLNPASASPFLSLGNE